MKTISTPVRGKPPRRRPPSANLALALALGLLAAAPARAADLDAAPFVDRSRTDCGLQKAIDSLAEKGGGVLNVPAGEYPLKRYLFLRSGVTLRGAGMGKTLLTVGNPPRFSPLSVPYDEAQAKLTLETADGLAPGMKMTIFSYGRKTHHVHRSHPTATAVDGQSVTVTNHSYTFRVKDGPYATWGNELRLAADAAKGESAIRVDTPALCRPGYALTLWGPGDQWNFHYNVITAVEGDKLSLERPLTVSGKAGDVVSLNFSAITAENQRGIGVEDLTIRGFVTEAFAGPWTGFQIAGIHTHKTSEIVIRRVAVENWSGDGISIQSAKDVLVSECVATGNYGHGFHPGTGMERARFEKLQSLRNMGDGLYYCWHNNGTDVYDSILSGNEGSGVGGLGNPGDRNCTISGNTIEDNALAGIEATGGGASHNVIRGNVIRNNSRAKPGARPGIGLYAIHSEPCLEVTVENNVIESTAEPATQTIGIEERPEKPDKRFAANADPVSGLFLSDQNRIVGNKMKGHEVADIVVAGPNTVVGEGQGKVEKRLPTPKAKEPEPQPDAKKLPRSAPQPPAK